MKVFISWSGNYSREVAEKLKMWIPSVIQSVDIFFSPDDIGKGENWDNVLSKELNDCNFGIICLTPENVSAPWIHFEAGALAKTLDSRLSSVMFGINTSDVKGPLSRFQNTKFEHDDFFKLLQDINDVSENPLKSEHLNYSFNALWEHLTKEIEPIIKKYENASTTPKVPPKTNDSDAIQEILSIVRKMSNSTLSDDKGIEKADDEPLRFTYYNKKKRRTISIHKRSQSVPLSDETKQILIEYLPEAVSDVAISSLENAGRFQYGTLSPLAVARATVSKLSESPDLIVNIYD